MSDQIENKLNESLQVSVSRRALVKAGWVVPVVLAVGIPRDAFAQNGSDAGSSAGSTLDQPSGGGRGRGRRDRDDDRGGNRRGGRRR